eukprot:355183-Pelagomonas_calceolata.AAC.2
MLLRPERELPAPNKPPNEQSKQWELGGRLLDRLLIGGRDASLEGWPTTRRIRISLYLLPRLMHQLSLSLTVHSAVELGAVLGACCERGSGTLESSATCAGPHPGRTRRRGCLFMLTLSHKPTATSSDRESGDCVPVKERACTFLVSILDIGQTATGGRSAMKA